MGLFSNRRIDETGPQQAQATYTTAPPPVQPNSTNIISSRQEVPISNDLMAKHEEAVQKFPRVHLTRGEYVVLEVRRHPVGLISIWVLMGLLVAGALALIPLYAANRTGLASILTLNVDKLPTVSSLTLPIVGLAALFLLGGMSAVTVYNGNIFYLTNESVIQYSQSSLFSTKEQMINLENIDDVSYRQQGMLQQIFNYGTIRVSTEGGEHGDPYIFYYVAKPQAVTRMINDAMEDATGFAVRYRQQHIGEQQPPQQPPEQMSPPSQYPPQPPQPPQFGQ